MVTLCFDSEKNCATYTYNVYSVRVIIQSTTVAIKVLDKKFPYTESNIFQQHHGRRDVTRSTADRTLTVGTRSFWTGSCLAPATPAT